MSKKTNSKLIGAFIVGGLVILLAAIDINPGNK